MATQLDVLSLADAKDYLAIDFPDWDSTITLAIYGMVNLVEQLTNYRLYERQEVIQVGTVKYDAFQYPINNIVSVIDQNGYPSVYKLEQLPLRWAFTFKKPVQDFYADDYSYYTGPAVNYLNTITLDVGYADTSKIPDAIVYAIKLLVTEVMENRIPTKESMPNDISMLLNPYMRSTYF